MRVINSHICSIGIRYSSLPDDVFQRLTLQMFLVELVVKFFYFLLSLSDVYYFSLMDALNATL